MSCSCQNTCCNKCGSGYISQHGLDSGWSFTHYEDYYDRHEDGPGLDHPLVKYYEEIWLKSRLAAKGGVAVAENAELFLHKLPGMTSDEYTYYQRQARFPQFVRRVKEAIAARVFHKPQERDEIFDYNSLDSEGLSFHALERWALDEVADVLWGGILVEIVEGQPKFVRYMAENVRNWKHNKSGQLIRLVLREYCEPDPFSFKHEPTERRRVLTLNNDVYVVQVYELIENKEDQKNKESSWRLIPNGEEDDPTDFVVPLTGDGNPLQGIPFFPFGGTMPGESMLVPLVEVAEDMYNLDAWKKNVLREGCFPQKVLNCTGEDDSSAEYSEGTNWFGDPVGDDAGPGPIELGTSKILIVRNAELSIVESSGASVKQVSEEQARLSEEAYDYGVSMFRVRAQSNVAAETERLQSSANVSVVNSMARYVQEAFQAALTVAAEWTGREVPVYQLHVDSNMSEIELKDIMAIIAGREAKLYANTDARQMLRDAGRIKRTDEEIDEDLEREGFDDLDLINA